MKKKVKKRIFVAALILVCLSLIFFILVRYLLSFSVKPGDYLVSNVDYGPVYTAVPANGIINPENEVLLLSPSSSVISSLYRAPGSRVSKGDIILRLDSKSLMQEIDNLKDQLEVMENDLQKNRLNSRSTRVDLDYSAEVKRLRITSLRTEIADQEQLLSVGGISPALHEQTKEELVLAEKDLNMTLEKNSIRLKQLEADEKGLQLQIDMRNKELALRQDLMERLTIRAPSDGIILGIYTNVGERVEKDKLLVKMSDLSTFKIEATIDNPYVSQVKTGGEVYALVNDISLKGKIGTVSPVMRDKKIEFDVFLDHSHYDKLIPNMEVVLQIVTQKKDSVLRVGNGPAFSRARNQDLFVINTYKAVKKTVTTGLIGTEHVEITDGLNPGDRVIVSNIHLSRHIREFELADL
ncbi:MAG: efflux RND transporter periplasmic adaptor subunit [Bacteroidales bacterium]|jgi:HlyD family secretion protein|nr:efflux RND transporter periplasmic adaptor subunit [Bacteroidales bacterium]